MGNTQFTDFEQSLLQDVSKDKLMEYNKGIAKFHRNCGTEEELESFKYIENELQKSGIATEMFFSDGYISLPVSASVFVDGKSYDCITHSMSTSVSELTAEVVYAGKGTPADYINKDVKGKIVVVEGLCMGNPVSEAEKQGAVGIIFLNDEHVHNMIGSKIWGSPSVEDRDILPTIAFLSVNSFAAKEIREVLEKKESVTAVMSTEVDTKWRRIPTLVGTIQGSTDPENYLLLSNHVDGWIYGAMDNGSANAALMEVVRILNAHKDQLKRSIKIAFWSGHSHGRYAGSTWYCDTHFEDLYEHCFLHINADSLGAIGSDILTEANCMAETKGIAAPVIAAIANQDYNGSRYGRAGDQSFWGTGTPSLFMGLSEQPIGEGTAAKSFALLMGNGKTGGFGWWWHSMEDTIDKIDPVRLVRDCKIYLICVYRACGLDYIPIDQHAAAVDIETILQTYASQTSGHIDFNLVLSRAKELVNITGMIEVNKEKLGAVAYNDYVMEMSRVLVPLNYVEGSIFEHDLAVRGKDIPILTVLNQFKGVSVGSDEDKYIWVVAIRRVNAVAFALKKAIKLAKSVLA